MNKRNEHNNEEELNELLKRATEEKEESAEDKVVTEEEAQQVYSSDEKAKKAFERLTDIEDEESVSVNLRNIIGGDILAGRWFRRQLPFLMFLCLLAIVYVTNRYAYQKEIIENKRLTLLLEDRRLRAVVATSDLTEYTRRSNIEMHLSDTTLKSSPAPFYYLPTK